MTEKEEQLELFSVPEDIDADSTKLVNELITKFQEESTDPNVVIGACAHLLDVSMGFMGMGELVLESGTHRYVFTKTALGQPNEV